MTSTSPSPIYTVKVTAAERDVLLGILSQMSSQDKSAQRRDAKIQLLRQYQHLIPDYEAIIEIGKAQGLWSRHSITKQTVLPLKHFAQRHGLHPSA